MKFISHGISESARLIALLGVLLLGAPTQALGARLAEQDWTSRVLRVAATLSDGTMELGSAVPVTPGHLVTNCHVLRDAVRVEVEWRGNIFRATSNQSDVYRDLCILTVPGLDVAPTPMIEMGETRVGMEVVAVGFPGGKFAAGHGQVVGLHTCECDGGKVIQTSAPFDRGASGGGLFDKQGRLVGILTFKAQSGGNFHFALPVGWLRHLANSKTESLNGGTNTFWERPGRESSYFLAACDFDAKQEWPALKKLAGEWVSREPYNPEAWMALGRAGLGLRHADEAANAFQKVLMLDSTNTQAHWALQQIEFDFGHKLMSASAI